jgi:hypothetical protein
MKTYEKGCFIWVTGTGFFSKNQKAKTLMVASTCTHDERRIIWFFFWEREKNT